MEIEIKAKINNLAEIRDKLLAQGANKFADKHQLDVYLSPPHKSFFKTPYYLRVRNDFKTKKDVFEYIVCKKGFGDTSVSEEKEVGVADGRQLLSILKDLDFTENCRIEKQREVFELNDFEIVLDKVKDLGNFIEVEVDAELEDEPKERKRIVAFLNELGVSEEAFIKDGGYVELLTGTSAKDW